MLLTRGSDIETLSNLLTVLMVFCSNLRGITKMPAYWEYDEYCAREMPDKWDISFTYLDLKDTVFVRSSYLFLVHRRVSFISFSLVVVTSASGYSTAGIYDPPPHPPIPHPIYLGRWGTWCAKGSWSKPVLCSCFASNPSHAHVL